MTETGARDVTGGGVHRPQRALCCFKADGWTPKVSRIALGITVHIAGQQACSGGH